MIPHDKIEESDYIPQYPPNLAFPPLGLSFYIKFSTPQTISVALYWTLSNSSASLLHWGAKTRHHVQVWSHKCRAEGSNHSPQPAGWNAAVCAVNWVNFNRRAIWFFSSGCHLVVVSGLLNKSWQDCVSCGEKNGARCVSSHSIVLATHHKLAASFRLPRSNKLLVRSPSTAASWL